MPGSEPNPELLISAAEVRRLNGRGEALVVLDARGRAAFARATERVAGDRRVPERNAFVSWAATLPGDAWLLAYCTCLNDGLAVRVAQRLRALGHAQAYAVAGGLEGCRQAGLPVLDCRSHGSDPADRP